MRVLFLGDIVGKSGRRVVKNLLSNLISQNQLDLVIANGENSAGGAGISPKTAEEIFEAGVDIITTGDHIWSEKGIYDYLNKNKGRFLRPGNYGTNLPGVGDLIFRCKNGAEVVVANLMGRVFMKELLNSPFEMATDLLERYKNYPIKFLDFHCEATSEKYAMAYHLNGKFSAVVGTHTHVQTADERVLDQGTAYITDLGMCGALDSVIGVEIEPIVERFVTGLPVRYAAAEGRGILNGVIVEVDIKTGKALGIKRVFEVEKE